MRVAGVLPIWLCLIVIEAQSISIPRRHSNAVESSLLRRQDAPQTPPDRTRSSRSPTPKRPSSRPAAVSPGLPSRPPTGRSRSAGQSSINSARERSPSPPGVISHGHPLSAMIVAKGPARIQAGPMYNLGGELQTKHVPSGKYDSLSVGGNDYKAYFAAATTSGQGSQVSAASSGHGTKGEIKALKGASGLIITHASHTDAKMPTVVKSNSWEERTGRAENPKKDSTGSIAMLQGIGNVNVGAYRAPPEYMNPGGLAKSDFMIPDAAKGSTEALKPPKAGSSQDPSSSKPSSSKSSSPNTKSTLDDSDDIFKHYDKYAQKKD